ncbi:hypothetical protein PFLUV_G00229610 [Perca fluviatilis]|uniref:Ig-like domain-containing protein n=1 Tax=Perca fluviatilis TaxID=8168 RepID=A0A6A5DQC1_PERFL|nr:hypothetical protein PFLUV_G00229610 [Perca fluviatilis]
MESTVTQTAEAYFGGGTKLTVLDYYSHRQFLSELSDTEFQSEAYFGAGTKLTVLEPGRNITKPRVKVLPPSERECRSQKDGPRKKTIVCVASGFYPDHVSVYWQVDGDNVTNGVATDNDALREGDFYRITSRLKVSGDDWFTLDKNFTCIVKFFNGIETSSHKDTVLGDEAYYLKISKTAKVSYALLIIKSSLYGAFVAFLVWKLQFKRRQQESKWKSVSRPHDNRKQTFWSVYRRRSELLLGRGGEDVVTEQPAEPSRC